MLADQPITNPAAGANATLSLRKRTLFTITFFLFSLAFVVSILLVIDLYLHKKYDTIPNYRGYRGRIVGKRQPNEVRFVVLGGSTAFGYGVTEPESLPALLEKELQKRFRRPVSVVNLAFNNQGAYSFLPTLKDYEYLEYDAVIMYEGYNDLRDNNTAVFRQDSPVFEMFGYYPAFPIIAHEKLLFLRYGSVDEGYRRSSEKSAALLRREPVKPAFTPGTRMERSAGVEFRRVIERSAAAAAQRGATEQAAITAKAKRSADCKTYGFYCNSVQAAVQYALSRENVVFVVTQPYIGPLHRQQQAELAGMLARRFATSQVRHINLGNALDLADTSLVYDGVHLVGAGNQIIAERLADSIVPRLAPTAPP